MGPSNKKVRGPSPPPPVPTPMISIQSERQTTDKQCRLKDRKQTDECVEYTFCVPVSCIELLKRRRVRPNELPKDTSAVALVHDPEDPCGIMTLSNLSASVHGNFTNTRRDLFSNREGLWSNGMFNTPGSTIDRGVSTFSNLQVCRFLSPWLQS